MPLRERLIDFAVPARTFKKPIIREIRVCLEKFDASLVKGIGVTVGRLGQEGRVGQALDVVKGRERGYFWEKDGVRHVVGQEIMSRKQERTLLELIHGVTLPYRESRYWEKSDDEIYRKPKP